MADFFNSNDLTGMFDSDDINKNKVLSAVAYIPVLFLIPLFVAGNSRYAKFNANQGIILTVYSLISAIICWLIGFIIGWIPYVGGLIKGIISVVLGASVLALMIIGILNVVNGKAKKLPIIGELMSVVE